MGQIFRRGDCFRSGTQDRLETFADRSVQFINRNFRMNQTNAKGMVRRKDLTGSEKVPSVARANLGQYERRNGGGDQTQPHFAERKLCPGRRNRDICRRHKTTSTPECGTVNLRNDHRRTIDNGLEEVRESEGVRRVLFDGISRRPSHPVQIASGTKGFAFAVDHYGPDARHQPFENVRESPNEAIIKGVPNFGAIQTDPKDPTFRLNFEHFGAVWHGTCILLQIMTESIHTQPFEISEEDFVATMIQLLRQRMWGFDFMACVMVYLASYLFIHLPIEQVILVTPGPAIIGYFRMPFRVRKLAKTAKPMGQITFHADEEGIIYSSSTNEPAVLNWKELKSIKKIARLYVVDAGYDDFLVSSSAFVGATDELNFQTIAKKNTRKVVGF